MNRLLEPASPSRLVRAWRKGPCLVLVALAVLVVTVASWAGPPTRAVKFTWDKSDALRAKFDFRDALNAPAVAKKLNGGMRVTVVMRAYVYPNGSGDPVALVAHQCRIYKDLWAEVYMVSVNGAAAKPVAVLEGVHKRCTDMADLLVVKRSALAGKADDYHLGVKVEVNPLSDDVIKKVQQWVTRPAGASGTISPGDALFASFVQVFMKKVPTADLVVEFVSASFPH